MEGALRPAACIAATIAIASCLAACGGGGDSTASIGDPAATTQKPSSEHPKSEAAERAAYEKARYGSPSPQSAPFGKYSGKAKLHLAEFGAEASSGERAGAQRAIEAYLQATWQGESEKACSYLSATVRGEIAQLSKASKGSSCGEILQTLADAPKSPGLASAGIASLRIERGGRAGEGAGFALFHGSDGVDYWMAMKREDRDWKVISTAPQPLHE